MRPFGEEAWAALLTSDGSEGATRSFLLRRPDRTLTLAADQPGDAQAAIRDFLASSTGMVLGLAAYELGARFEPVELARDPDWPDLVLAHYPTWLEFDHAAQAVAGRGAEPEAALAWLGDLALPTAIGLLLFSVVAALAAYGLTHIGWRIWVSRRWARRLARRARPAS